MTIRTSLNRPALRPSERAVLHLLRLGGAMSKAELARLSAMSAQGVSVIVDRLLDLSLVVKGAKQRGKVGQPSTPIALNPDGALAMGIFVGREGGEIVLSDFAGDVLHSTTVDYDDPTDPDTPALLHDAAMELALRVDPKAWQGHVGTCIAAGEAALGVYLGDAATPAGTKPLARRLETAFGAPVHCINDIRAACLAELTLGNAHARANLLYFSIGQWLGSGIVLEGRLIGEETCLPSAIHALPISLGEDGRVGDFTSLASLGRMLAAEGFDPCAERRTRFAASRPIFDAWRARAIEAFVFAIRSARATVPLDSVMIESRLEPADLALLVEELRAALVAQGVDVDVTIGSFGTRARAMGTAMVPFFKMFGPVENPVHANPPRRAVA